MFPVRSNMSFFLPVSVGPVNRIESVLARVPAGCIDAPVSVWVEGDTYRVAVELPGMTESDVSVTLHQGTLFVRGERKCDRDRKFLYNTRAFGPFERRIVLPDDVQTDGVQATLADGVLQCVLPKRPEARPRRIEVQTN